MLQLRIHLEILGYNSGASSLSLRNDRHFTYFGKWGYVGGQGSLVFFTAENFWTHKKILNIIVDCDIFKIKGHVYILESKAYFYPHPRAIFSLLWEEEEGL